MPGQSQALTALDLLPTPSSASNAPTDDDVIDAVEAGRILKVHPVTVRLKAAAGQIPGRQIGNRWRFSRTRLREWLQAA